MKTKLLFCVLALAFCFSIFSELSYAQGNFYDKSQSVTSGFIDKNPNFDSKRIYNVNFAYICFLAFERWIDANSSNICVKKFGFDSAYGPVKYITNDNNKINRNPQLAYKHVTGPDSVSNAMLVWEKVENSRVNIYGATYSNSVWSAPYPIDTGAGNKSSPHIALNTALYSGNVYSVVYEKNGDIFYLNYESVLNQITNFTNLTDTISSVCRNPNVCNNLNSQPVFVTYERQKANSDFAIYYKKAGSNYIFTGDTLALRGNNRNVNFLNAYYQVAVSYESNFSGKWGIYEYVYGNSQPSALLQNTVFNYRNLENFLFPIITNNPNFSSMLTAYIIQRPSVTKIFSTVALNLPMDSITVGDSSSKCNITVNNGLFRNMSNFARVWMVFEKDSAGFSTLEARGKLVVLGNIHQIGNTVPDKYSLSQNYPNPFNPRTVIRFNIPNGIPSLEGYVRPGGRGVGMVTLKIFDITGREIRTLINESLAPGTYETTFDGSRLSSGIYFYKLTAGDFSQTKRLTLLK